jgi:hypothetical protein
VPVLLPTLFTDDLPFNEVTTSDEKNVFVWSTIVLAGSPTPGSRYKFSKRSVGFFSLAAVGWQIGWFFWCFARRSQMGAQFSPAWHAHRFTRGWVYELGTGTLCVGTLRSGCFSWRTSVVMTWISRAYFQAQATLRGKGENREIPWFLAISSVNGGA